MTNEEIGYAIGIFGSLASIISLIIYFFQRRKIISLELHNERNIWKQLAANKAMMRHLEREDVQQAYGLVCEQFRDLLKEASLNENKFNLKTIKLWRKVGKLSSDWQERQALILLSTKEIEETIKITDEELVVKESYTGFDNTPDNHPVAKVKPVKNKDDASQK